MVLGDSTATSWLPALRRLLDPEQWSIQVLTKNPCTLPHLGFWREDAREWREGMARTLWEPRRTPIASSC